MRDRSLAYLEGGLKDKWVLTIYTTCQCGHTGSTTDERAVRSHMAGKGFKGRCSQCGALNSFTSVLSYDVGINPMTAACGDKSAPVPDDLVKK